MPAQWHLTENGAQLCDQRAYASRRGRADRVGDAEPVDAAIACGCGDVENPLRRRGPVEGAIPRRGDDDLDADIAVVGDGDDLTDLFGGLCAAPPDVGLAERVAGRYHVFDRT